MTGADRAVLRRLSGGTFAGQATTDDLQGLLLQVVFALLMIFMIAYFIFVEQQKKQHAEEVMALNRQKLTLAIEKVAEERRVRYGINALLVQGVDGRRVFEPDTIVSGASIVLAPAAKRAFAVGGRAAWTDYSNIDRTREVWRRDVLSAAELDDSVLTPEENEWFAKALETELENVRLDVRGVQRALAARLQRNWIEHPDALSDARDPRALAELIRRKSLEAVATEIGSEVLP